jgi:hypothetical protein
MFYGDSIWLTPMTRSLVGGLKSKGSVGAATKLNRVQRMASIHITGAMRTTAQDVLNVHADLCPIDLLIDKHCYREALRLSTIPSTHPLHTHIRSAAKRKPHRHPSPLHMIFHMYKLKLERIETIAPV